MKDKDDFHHSVEDVMRRFQNFNLWKKNGFSTAFSIANPTAGFGD